jgi:hypothetical protein
VIHILYIRYEGISLGVNSNAQPLEIYCAKKFQGPLVVAMNDNKKPYSLLNFTLEDLSKIATLNFRNNKVPLKNKNSNFVSQNKKFSNLISHFKSSDGRENARENMKKNSFQKIPKPEDTGQVFDYENQAKLLENNDYTKLASQTVEEIFSTKQNLSPEQFYMYRFKTCYCPFNQRHNPHFCLFAHSPQDFR